MKRQDATRKNNSIQRREFLKRTAETTLAVGAISVLGFPAVLRGATPPPIKIGHIHPMTGFLAFMGGQLRNGLLLAVDEINAAGGIKSLDGAKLQLMDGDSEGKPEVSITEVERFNNAGCIAVLGSLQSAVTLVATQQAERLRLPFVVSVSVSDKITSRGFKYTFRLQPHSGHMVGFTMQYLDEIARENGVTIKTISHLHDNTSFGTSLFQHVERLAPKYNWEIVADVPYSPRATDVSTEINKVKFANADLVFHSGYFSDSIRALRTMLDLRVKAKGIVGMANGAYSQAKFVEEMGPKSENVMDGNYRANPKSSLTKHVFADYKKRFDAVMPSHSVYSYQAVKVIADALERSGSREREALRDALAKTNLSRHILPQDAIRFGSDGQNVNARAVLMQILNRQVKVVWPSPYAQARPVFPHS